MGKCCSISDIYWPKRSFGQGNIFTSVCQEFYPWGVPDQAPPLPRPGRYTPLDQAGNPPWTRQVPPPREQTPPPRPGRYPPGPDTPPPGTADSGIRSTFGRYASYWNAFMFSKISTCLSRQVSCKSTCSDITDERKK